MDRVPQMSRGRHDALGAEAGEAGELGDLSVVEANPIGGAACKRFEADHSRRLLDPFGH